MPGPVSDDQLIDQLVKVIEAEAEARRNIKTATEDGARMGAKKERESISGVVNKFAKAATESEVTSTHSPSTTTSASTAARKGSAVGHSSTIVKSARSTAVK